MIREREGRWNRRSQAVHTFEVKLCGCCEGHVARNDHIFQSVCAHVTAQHMEEVVRHAWATISTGQTAAASSDVRRTSQIVRSEDAYPKLARRRALV